MHLEPGPAAVVQRWWADHRRILLPAAIALMAAAALIWLTYEFWRLLFQQPPWGAIDLRHRYIALHGWFRGDIVHLRETVLDPPATHAMLWPLIGWTSLGSARWIWAVTSAAALAWTAGLAVRHSGAVSPHERMVAALLPLSMYAPGATVGNGQLAVHLLPLLLAGCLRLKSGGGTWRGDLPAAALLLAALVKPNLAAPFMWIVLFVPRSRRPALLVASGYAVLTVVAASFQPADLVTLFRQPLEHASRIAARPVSGNVHNLHVWLGLLGLQRFGVPASALVFGLLGAWIYRHRRVELWLLLGVTGYVALFWSYHRWYDEVLLLLPAIALFRLAKTSPDIRSSVAAGILLALTMLSTVAPGGLFLLPAPLNLLYLAGQLAVWIAGLCFLAARASAARHERPPPAVAAI